MPDTASSQKLSALQDLLKSYGRVAIGFSGGVDSTFLAAVCQRIMPEDTLLVHLTTPLIGTSEQGSFHGLTAGTPGSRGKLAELSMIEIMVDQLQNPTVAANDPDRCYHCKSSALRALWKRPARTDLPR